MSDYQNSMHILTAKTKLPPVTSYEEFEQLKSKKTIFETLAKEIINYHEPYTGPILSHDATNIVYSYGKNRIIKIYPPVHLEHFKTEVLVMRHLENKLSVKTPPIHFEGMISGWPYLISTQLDGVILEGLWEKLDDTNKKIILLELGMLIREVHSLPVIGLEAIDSHWPQFITHQINHCVKQHQNTHLHPSLIKQIPDYLSAAKQFLPSLQKTVLLTGEYTPMNILVEQKEGIWHINGLIDFGDCMLGVPEYDLLGPGVFLIQGNKQLLREFLLAYGYPPEKLTPLLQRQLTALMLLHRYSNLKVQIRIKNWESVVKNIADFENVVWGF